MAIVPVTNYLDQGMISKSTQVVTDIVPKGNSVNSETEIIASGLVIDSEKIVTTPVIIDKRIVLAPDRDTLVTLTENAGAITVDMANQSQSYTFTHSTDALVIEIINYTYDPTEFVSFTIERRHDGTTNTANIDWVNSTINAVAGGFSVTDNTLGQNPDDINLIAIEMDSNTQAFASVDGTSPAPAVLFNQEITIVPNSQAQYSTYVPPIKSLVATAIAPNEVPVFSEPTVLSGSGITLTDDPKGIVIATTNGTPVITDGISKGGAYKGISATIAESAGSLTIDLSGAGVTQYVFTHATTALIINIITGGSPLQQDFILKRIKSDDATERTISWTTSTVEGATGTVEQSGSTLGQAALDENIIRFQTRDGVRFTAVIGKTASVPV